MTYDAFLEQMKKDLEFDFATELPDKYSGVKIGIRDVEKLQGESYRGISFKNGDSPVEGNMNMQLAYEAHEAGRSFSDILHETEQAIMQQVDRMPQFDLGVMSDCQAMKPKLMTELIPQKGNEEKLADVPHEKIEDLALICRLDLGERNGGRKLVDILAGDFLVVGLTEDSFGSLTPEQMQRYEQKFHQPETFVRMGKSIMALPIPDKEVQRRESMRKEQPEQKAGKVIRFPKEPAL